MSRTVPIKTLLKRGTEILAQAGIENARSESLWLAGSAFQLSSQEFLLHPERLVNGSSFFSLIRKRAKGQPLQYLLGSQDFMGMELSVGKGVLIPRPETELLCRVAAAMVTAEKPVILDLCAGSGCVSLGLRQLLPHAQITAVEKYAAAIRYLKQNIRRYRPDISIVKANILISALSSCPTADLIVSNPPYIEHDTLPGLQKEVGHEPTTALDGGPDGLLFYRRIVHLAERHLKPGGALAVEIGAEQGSAVSQIFSQSPFAEITVHQDAAGLDRVVSCIKA